MISVDYSERTHSRVLSEHCDRGSCCKVEMISFKQDVKRCRALDACSPVFALPRYDLKQFVVTQEVIV